MFNKKLLVLPLVVCLATGCGKTHDTDTEKYINEITYEDSEVLDELSPTRTEVVDSWNGVESVTDAIESTTNSKSVVRLEENGDTFSFDSSKKAIVNDVSEAEIILETAMIAKNVNIKLEVDDLDSFSDSLTQAVNSFGGYYEESDVNNYTSEYETTRKGYFTIRIPSEKLDDFLKKADESGNVVNKNISTEDVSLNYVDTAAKIESLEAEKEALQKLMESANSVDEVIAIQDRLSSVQYKLDSANGQKRYLEGKVNYSCVKIDAVEKRVVDNKVKRPFFARFKEKFLSGMETVVNVFVSLLVAIPTIVVITGFILAFIYFFKKAWKKVFKKEKKSYRYVLTPVYETSEEVSEKASK